MNETTAKTYSVPEISCDHCKSTIEGALAGLDGLRTATVDIDARTVTVDGGDDGSIITAIEDVGFDVER